jgi:hypothetical protein
VGRRHGQGLLAAKDLREVARVQLQELREPP